MKDLIIGENCGYVAHSVPFDLTQIHTGEIELIVGKKLVLRGIGNGEFEGSNGRVYRYIFKQINGNLYVTGFREIKNGNQAIDSKGSR